MSILYLVLGLALLVFGGELLVRASVAISFKMNISKMVIGLTVVSFATSLPELLVSLQAAVNGFSDISLGNVIGSNIANIGLILGVTSLISPLMIGKDFYGFNGPVMVFFSFLLYFFLYTGGILSRVEGIILVLAMVVYIFMLLRRARKNSEVEVEDLDVSLERTSNLKVFFWLVLGGFLLWAGSKLLVNGAVDLAQMMEISERVISVTIIALGTSVPELAASLIAALKKEGAISVGNLIGSNIFNIGSVLGITAIIQPILLKSAELLSRDIFWMIGFGLILFPLVFLPKKFRFGRLKGGIILAAYIVFVSLAFVQ